MKQFKMKKEKFNRLDIKVIMKIINIKQLLEDGNIDEANYSHGYCVAMVEMLQFFEGFNEKMAIDYISTINFNMKTEKLK